MGLDDDASVERASDADTPDKVEHDDASSPHSTDAGPTSEGATDAETTPNDGRRRLVGLAARAVAARTRAGRGVSGRTQSAGRAVAAAGKIISPRRLRAAARAGKAASQAAARAGKAASQAAARAGKAASQAAARAG